MTTPLPVNVTGMQEFGLYLNSVTNDLWAPLTLLGIFVVFMLVLRLKTAETNLAVSGLFTLLISGGFAAMEWVEMIIPIAIFGLTAIAFFIIRTKENAGY